MPAALVVPVLGVAGAAVAALVIASFRVAGSALPGPLDATLELAVVTRVPADATPVRLLVGLGDPVPAAVLCTALAAASALAHRVDLAALALTAPVVAVAVTVGLKTVVGRTYVGNLSFPSGHTAFVTTVLALVAVVAVGRARRTGVAAVLAAVGVLLGATAVGVALVAHGQHYASDTGGGFCVGLATLLLCAVGLDHLRDQLRSRHGDGGGPAGAPPAVQEHPGPADEDDQQSGGP